jgi:Pyruvate/2-oxoacid:ferredoxin oxidoreductase gamma subunit
VNVEREILFTGIGGQGIQLGAEVLARAAVAEGREVMLFGSYGGTMRGGPSESTLVVGDAPLTASPIVSRAWAAIAMHPAYWQRVAAKLVPDAVVVVNTSLFDAPIQTGGCRVIEIPATRLATECGGPLTAAMVLVGAFAAATGIAALVSLRAGLDASLPERRRQHREQNERGLELGFASAPPGSAPAFPSDLRSASPRCARPAGACGESGART